MLAGGPAVLHAMIEHGMRLVPAPSWMEKRRTLKTIPFNTRASAARPGLSQAPLDVRAGDFSDGLRAEDRGCRVSKPMGSSIVSKRSLRARRGRRQRVMAKARGQRGGAVQRAQSLAQDAPPAVG